MSVTEIISNYPNTLIIKATTIAVIGKIGVTE